MINYVFIVKNVATYDPLSTNTNVSACSANPLELRNAKVKYNDREQGINFVINTKCGLNNPNNEVVVSAATRRLDGAESMVDCDICISSSRYVQNVWRRTSSMLRE